MNWEGGRSFDQMVRDSIDDLFTEVLFHENFFSLFLFQWGMNRETIQCSGEMWDGRVWLVPYDRRKSSMPVCWWNGLVRRGESECQTIGNLQHKGDRQEPQEHNHILCSM